METAPNVGPQLSSRASRGGAHSCSHSWCQVRGSSLSAPRFPRLQKETECAQSTRRGSRSRPVTYPTTGVVAAPETASHVKNSLLVIHIPPRTLACAVATHLSQPPSFPCPTSPSPLFYCPLWTIFALSYIFVATVRHSQKHSNVHSPIVSLHLDWLHITPAGLGGKCVSNEAIFRGTVT